jgi:hypothetical protein
VCRLEVPLTPKAAATAAQGKFDAGTSSELQRALG